MIQRQLESILVEKMFSGKALILIGARQVGKTTLLKQFTDDRDDVLWLNADEMMVRTLLQDMSIEKFRSMIGKRKILVVDEAQRIENIGLKMKLIVDTFQDVQLILTGSSSFDLSNKINEPLTGRKWEYTLFPLSFGEMVAHTDLLTEIKHLPLRMVYGYYPDVVNNPGSEREIINQLSNSYLYKDILEWENVKKSDKLIILLQALAYQVGSEVSLSELGRQVELDKNTIEKYISLLEQCQVIFRLSSFSRNLRNELKHSRKIYFYDNGIRNSLISNFSDLSLRADVGALWENWMISELIKKRHYDRTFVNRYFWRTTQQQEIDYIEESDGKLTAYEFKWNPKKRAKISQTFLNAYPETEIKTITESNFYEILTAH